MPSKAEPVSEESFEHGEGIRLDPRTGELLWVDLHQGSLYRGRLSGGAVRGTVRYDIGGKVGSVAPLAEADAGWVLAVRDGFAHLSQAGVLAPIATGLTAAGQVMNDGVCDPGGSFWAGSQAIPRKPVAALYRLDPTGTATRALGGVTVSNGIGFAPDGRTMYYIDTLPHRRLEAFDVRDGRLARRRTIVQVHGGNPDGLAIDDEGCVWVAVWDGWRIDRYAPDGRLLTTVDVPAPRPTAVCFAGATLLITTARTGPGNGPRDSGRIFAVDANVSGPPAQPWRGRGAPAVASHAGTEPAPAATAAGHGSANGQLTSTDTRRGRPDTRGRTLSPPEGKEAAVRVCFTLQVDPARLADYRARHAAVWPEMLAALRDAGWRDYTLHLREDGLLVGVLETDVFAVAQRAIAATEVNERWQTEMAEFFPGGRPGRTMCVLDEVFNLDAQLAGGTS